MATTNIFKRKTKPTTTCSRQHVGDQVVKKKEKRMANRGYILTKESQTYRKLKTHTPISTEGAKGSTARYCDSTPNPPLLLIRLILSDTHRN